MEYLDKMSPVETGGYILLLDLEESCEIGIGRLGVINFDSGYYAYIGSAMRGLKQRISRHLRKEKKLYWHIDYLLEKVSVSNVIVWKSGNNIECDIAGEIGSIYNVISRFGSSDCKCPGHLFYSPMELCSAIIEKVTCIGVNPQLILNQKDDGN